MASNTDSKHYKYLKKYHDHLPEDLRKEFHDIVVIHATDNADDIRKACEYAARLESEVVLRNSTKISIVPLELFAPTIGSVYQHLEETIDTCSY